MKKLQIAKGLDLPIEMAGQAVALVGIRGSGKTNTAGVIAEELLDQGQQIVVIDPTDAWWGLRSKYPVFIFGGPHGDLPLTEADGKTLAEFVVQERVPIILSLRHLRKGAQRRLMTEFCEELYHLKGQPAYRTPLTVFIDEAPQFIPQRVMGEMARLVGAVQDMILLGRSVGFGVVMISQRFATLNADVRTQADTVVVHRLPSPLDRKALSEWIEENATIDQQKEVLSSLATLKTGEAWVWAPYFDLFKRAQIRPRHTFDSSAAPKRDGAAAAAGPKDLKAIDLEKLKGKLSAAIEKAKAEDPRELKRLIAQASKDADVSAKRISDLEARLSKTSGFAHSNEGPTKKETARAGKIAELQQQLTRHRRALEEAMKILVKVKAVDFSARGGEALEEAVTAAIKQVTAGIDKKVNAMAERVASIHAAAQAAEAAIAKLLDEKIELNVVVQKHAPYVVHANSPQPPPRTPRAPVAYVDAGLSGPEQKILNSLAELEALGLHPADKQQLGLMAGYTNVRSGGFSEPLGRLIAGGYATSPQAGKVAITDAGRAAAGDVQPPADPEEMQQRIMAKLSGPEQKLLKVIIARYPNAINKEDLGTECGYTNIRSGGFSEPLGRLNTLGIISTPVRGEVVASPALFLEGR